MGKKRIVVACDGTWVDSDNGFVRDSWLPWKTGGRLATPSNVTRLCRALLPRSENGESQVVYYQAGLGSANNWYSYYIGGYLGDGISENIREAYAFVCNNYEPGDDIVLVGFSRGAFTARSIGGLIGSIGLLTKAGMGAFYPVFKDWENQTNLSYKPMYGNSIWPVDRPKFSDPSYVPTLVKAGLTRPDIPIKAIGVWDTVGTLGVPEITILGMKFFNSEHREYSFIDTRIGSNVEHAYQALAIDEQRKAFSPSLWESPAPGTPSQLKVLRQCWFPGVHATVGGGYQDTSISDITLAWMITQLSNHLTFDQDYVLAQQRLNVQFYVDHNLPIAPWAMGALVRSDGGFLNTLTGRQVRTPGEYCATDPRTGKPTDRRLVNTCEYIHPSVRYRLEEHGPPLQESAQTPAKGVYAPAAMVGWEYFGPNEKWRSLNVNFGADAEKWDGFGKWVKSGTSCFIVEEEIERNTAEGELVYAWPGVAERVLG